MAAGYITMAMASTNMGRLNVHVAKSNANRARPNVNRARGHAWVGYVSTYTWPLST